MSLRGQIVIHIDSIHHGLSHPQATLHLTGDFGIDSTPCVIRAGDTITFNFDIIHIAGDPPTYLNSDVVLPVISNIRRVLKK